MDEITKQWRNFLVEGEKIPYQICCDMDGVLVDLTEGIVEALGLEDLDDDLRAAAVQAVESGVMWRDLIKKEKEYPELSLGTKEIFKIISNKANFWANLPLKSDAQQLWSYLSSFSPSPYILSAPWDEESRKGKIMWLSEIAGNLSPVPDKDKIILTHKKHLHAINPKTNMPNILIDDMDKYIDPWNDATEAAGYGRGFSIKHVSTKRTLEELKIIVGINSQN